jgi:hypothetical protein
MKTLENLRQQLRKTGSGGFVSAPEAEYADSRARPGRARKEEEEVTNSLLYKDFAQGEPGRESYPLGPRRTDNTDKTRGPCIRCKNPVTRANGFRNWFGQPVHLTCPHAAQS